MPNQQEIADASVAQRLRALGMILGADGVWRTQAQILNEQIAARAATAARANEGGLPPLVTHADNFPPLIAPVVTPPPSTARDVTELLGNAVTVPDVPKVELPAVQMQQAADVAALTYAPSPTFYLPSVESPAMTAGESNDPEFSPITFTSNSYSNGTKQSSLSSPNGGWSSESREEQDWEFAQKVPGKKGRKKARRKKR